MVDLQKSEAFRSLGVELLSISPDPVDAWEDEGGGLGITMPMLSDEDNRVWLRYGIVDWMMATNEPGHTFFLVGPDGRLAWVRDYGAPENGGLMYVSPKELVREIEDHLSH